jgi:hypothetical protein
MSTRKINDVVNQIEVGWTQNPKVKFAELINLLNNVTNIFNRTKGE